MIVAAALAGLLNLVVLRAGDDRVPVAVVTTPVAAGEALTSDLVTVTRVAVDDAVLATLVPTATVETLADAVAVTDLAPGALLRRDDVRSAAAAGGQRAMSIPVDPAHAAGGDLVPGDRVDVIDVHDGAASYVVTDAEVLAVSDRGGALGGLEAFSVTVAVDGDTALLLAAAVRNETIELVRSTGAAPLSGSDR